MRGNITGNPLRSCKDRKKSHTFICPSRYNSLLIYLMINNDQSSSQRNWGHHLSHIVHLRYTWIETSSVLATWLHPEEKQISHIFTTESIFATQSKAPTEIKFLFSHRNWEVGVLSSLMLAFLLDCSWVPKMVYLP